MFLSQLFGGRGAQRKFAAIARSQAVIEFKLDGTIVSANENFCKAMGYRLADIVGRHHSIFVDPAEANHPDYQAFWRRLRAGEFSSGKFRRFGKGGREVWIQASYNPVLDAFGRVKAVVKVAADITGSEQTNRANEASRIEHEQGQRALVSQIGSSLSRLSDGDLTARMPPGDGKDGYDVIRANFNSAMTSLGDAIGTATGIMQPLTHGAGEIASAATDLAKRTEQQAANLEEAAAALDEVTSTSRRSAASAREASSVATLARTEAQASGAVVADAVAAMGEIERSSQKISEIIGVIDEIAFQTNLLALNAGVEAARAGESGRGFAVVAQEVRELAGRSAVAAKDIKALISTSRSEVDRGVALVGATGQALTALTERASQIDRLILDVAMASEEQSSVLAEVSQAVTQVDRVTQENAAMVEEALSTANELRRRADELEVAISRFELGAPGEVREYRAA